MDKVYKKMVFGYMACTKLWNNFRRLVGISRARMGRLLGLGSCRKCILYALVNRNSFFAFYNNSRKEKHASIMEYDSNNVNIYFNNFWNISYTKWRNVISSLIYPISTRAFFLIICCTFTLYMCFSNYSKFI